MKRPSIEERRPSGESIAPPRGRWAHALAVLLVLGPAATAHALDWTWTALVFGVQTGSSTVDQGAYWEMSSTQQITNNHGFAIEDVHLVPYGTCFGGVPVGGCSDPGTRLTWNDVSGRWESGGTWMEAQSVDFRLLIDPAVTNLPVFGGWNYSAGDSLPAIFVGDLAAGQTVSQNIVFHGGTGGVPLYWGWAGVYVGKPVICGDGVVSGAEQCDDGNTADGDCCSSTCTIEPTGTVCRDAVGTCDVAETCDGVSDSCPADVGLPDGSSCDDGDACTTDACLGGACVGDPTPDPGLTCRAAGKSILVVKEPDATGLRDKLIWKWLNGTTPLPAFGDPSSTDGFEVCIYDETAGSILAASAAPAGGNCAGRPCWKATGTTGWKYKDKALTPDGLLLLRLKEGTGTSKIILKGKGGNLALPALPPAGPVSLTARLIGGAGDCWESTFTEAGVQKSDTKTFKAKGP